MEIVDIAMTLPRLRRDADLGIVVLAAATATGVPQCIKVTDSGGAGVAQLRIDDARLKALNISMLKVWTCVLAGAADLNVALATNGLQAVLVAGPSIWIEGNLAGDIDVPVSPEQVNRFCAMAAFEVSPRVSRMAP